MSPFLVPIFFPLIGAIIVGFFGWRLRAEKSSIITTGLMVISAAMSVWVFDQVALQGHAQTIHLLNWITVDQLHINWALRFDTLSVIMIGVVNIVSACVHLYSIGYMHHDPHQPRFFAYLSLFTFFMLMLVTSDNLVQMFFGWEGVGLASYLLIGFWHQKPSANKAAMKAFIVNRVGDFGFSLGIFALFYMTGSVMLDNAFAAAPQLATQTIHIAGYDLPALTTICLLLFIGAMGKSAQLGLHTWLPDAMEGPTPVSALIHAATMVTAGVFMVARMSPLFDLSPTAMMVVTIVGATTAFFAATIGLVQNDIKRVIAYSTCSQLGYMFFACGVGAYSAGIFHLTTHAFFKALLFLGAGSVIHAVSNEQDMRKMGGLWNKIPFTYAMMWIGSLALAGIPYFAGYFSKDAILVSAWAAHSDVGMYAYVMGILAAIMTAFYSWRLLFLTFHGAPRMNKTVQKHIHESPLSMTVPLLVLAIGSVGAGYVGVEYFLGEHATTFWNNTLVLNLVDHHHIPHWVEQLVLGAAIAGIVLATLFYMVWTNLPRKIAHMFGAVYRFLYNKWYFDELYDFLFVRPAMRLGKFLWHAGDEKIIDGFGPNGLAKTCQQISHRVISRLQTGYVSHYAFAMLIGIVGFVTWFFYKMGGLK